MNFMYCPALAPTACKKLTDATPEQVREMLRSLICEGEVAAHHLILVFRTSEVARLLGWDGIGLFEGDKAAWRTNEPCFTVHRPLDEVKFTAWLKCRSNPSRWIDAEMSIPN